MYLIKKSFFIAYIATFILTGCSAGDGNHDLEGPPKEDHAAQQETQNNCTIDFYDSERAVWDPYEYTRNIRESQLYSLITPISIYKMTTGDWPTSWKDLNTNYLPLLPADPNTGLAYKMLNYGDYYNSAPADSIVAKWDVNGPTLFIGLPNEEGWECYSIGDALFQMSYNNFLTTPQKGGVIGGGFEYPEYRLVLMLSSWCETCLSTFLAEFKALPENSAQLLKGFIINPDFNPGYQVDYENKAGTFQFAVNAPAEKYYINYVVGTPQQNVGYYFHVQDGLLMNRQRVDPKRENFDDYTILLSEADFFN